jgi:hypothetical protein
MKTLTYSQRDIVDSDVSSAFHFSSNTSLPLYFSPDLSFAPAFSVGDVAALNLSVTLHPH